MGETKGVFADFWRDCREGRAKRLRSHAPMTWFHYNGRMQAPRFELPCVLAARLADFGHGEVAILRKSDELETLC